jgi:hypothetical protein
VEVGTARRTSRWSTTGRADAGQPGADRSARDGDRLDGSGPEVVDVGGRTGDSGTGPPVRSMATSRPATCWMRSTRRTRLTTRWTLPAAGARRSPSSAREQGEQVGAPDGQPPEDARRHRSTSASAADGSNRSVGERASTRPGTLADPKRTLCGPSGLPGSARSSRPSIPAFSVTTGRASDSGFTEAADPTAERTRRTA